MPLFEINPDQLRPLSQASLADMKVRERNDLQRLLRTQIHVLDENVIVVAEFSGIFAKAIRELSAAFRAVPISKATEYVESLGQENLGVLHDPR